MPRPIRLDSRAVLHGIAKVLAVALIDALAGSTSPTTTASAACKCVTQLIATKTTTLKES